MKCVGAWLLFFWVLTLLTLLPSNSQGKIDSYNTVACHLEIVEAKELLHASQPI